MKKYLVILCTLVIASMCFCMVAQGSDDGSVTLPRLPIPTQSSSQSSSSEAGSTEAGSDPATDNTSASTTEPTTLSEAPSDYEVSGIPFSEPSSSEASSSEKPTSQTTKTTTVAPVIKTISLNKCTVSNIKKKKIFTGKAIIQKPVVKYKNTVLKKGRDYTVTYKRNVKVGTAKIIIKGIGKFSGKVTRTFKIYPKATKLLKVSSPKKQQLKVVWNKQAKQVSGYQVQYSTSASFKKGVTKTVTVKGAKRTAKVLKKLKSNKNYYVRVRTYKTVGKTKYYSSWSAKKAVKTQ